MDQALYDQFLQNTCELYDEFNSKKLENLAETGLKFKELHENSAKVLLQERKEHFDQSNSELEKLFKAFCIQKAENVRNQQISERISSLKYEKGLQQRVFSSLKSHVSENKYLYTSSQYHSALHNRNLFGKILKQWREITIKSKRQQVQQKCLKKKEGDIQGFTLEAEEIIKKLRVVLEQKLIELKGEETEHQLIKEKYELMVEKQKVNLQANRKPLSESQSQN